jgi:hypothetical protein
MSGGHWDYSHHQIRECLEAVADDKTIREDFPTIARAFKELSAVMYEIVHDLDWHLSGDTTIHDPKKFEKEAVNKIMEACLIKR